MKLRYLFSLLILVGLCLVDVHSFSKTSRKSASSTKKYVAKKNYKKPLWGLDVSHHQGTIKWKEISKQKPHFMFFKATEGITHPDTRFQENFSNSRKHGIMRGAYHFFSYKSSGEEQARFYIDNVDLKKGDLPPVLDLEFKRRMPKKAEVTKNILRWIHIVENHYGVKPILYLDYDYYVLYLKGKLKKNYPLWICDYKNRPPVKWAFWQKTDRHRVKGIRGHVDFNVFSGNKSQLLALSMAR